MKLFKFTTTYNPPAPTRICRVATIDKIFSKKKLRQTLKKKCQRNISIENYYFIRETLKIKSRRRLLTEKLINVFLQKFIYPDSKYCINIPYHMRKNIILSSTNAINAIRLNENIDSNIKILYQNIDACSAEVKKLVFNNIIRDHESLRNFCV